MTKAESDPVFHIQHALGIHRNRNTLYMLELEKDQTNDGLNGLLCGAYRVTFLLTTVVQSGHFFPVILNKSGHSPLPSTRHLCLQNYCSKYVRNAHEIETILVFGLEMFHHKTYVLSVGTTLAVICR